jgi:hypothetical protein
MYYKSSMACSEPNSQTPMTAAAVAAQDAFIAQVGSDFVNGDNALSALINALGGNTVNAQTGDAGIPTVGVPYFNPSTGAMLGGSAGAITPVAVGSTGGAPVDTSGDIPVSGAPGTARHARSLAIWRRNRHLFGGGPGGGGYPLGVPAVMKAQRLALMRGSDCSQLPQVFPLITVFPTPPIGPVAMAPAPAPVSAPAPAAPAPAPAAPVAIPSTGNVCADLALGLVLISQLDPKQQLYCSNNGYTHSNKVPPSWVSQAINAAQAAGRLPQIPFQQSPPNTGVDSAPPDAMAIYNSLFSGPPAQGVSGIDVSDASGTVLWGALLALGVTAWYLHEKKVFG